VSPQIQYIEIEIIVDAIRIAGTFTRSALLGGDIRLYLKKTPVILSCRPALPLLKNNDTGHINSKEKKDIVSILGIRTKEWLIIYGKTT
jgi:hypothetical protein